MMTANCTKCRANLYPFIRPRVNCIKCKNDFCMKCSVEHSPKQQTYICAPCYNAMKNQVPVHLQQPTPQPQSPPQAAPPPKKKEEEEILKDLTSDVEQLEKKLTELDDNIETADTKDSHRQCLQITEMLMQKQLKLDGISKQELRTERRDLTRKIQTLLDQADSVKTKIPE